jgi:hypothetical protein
MGFAIVFIVSVAVGVAVYRLTERAPGASREPIGPRPGSDEEEATETGGWSGEPEPPRNGPARIQLSPETAAIPVVRGRPSWHSRLNGAMGLVVAVGFGAIAIALAMYGLGSFLVKLVDLGPTQ